MGADKPRVFEEAGYCIILYKGIIVLFDDEENVAFSGINPEKSRATLDDFDVLRDLVKRYNNESILESLEILRDEWMAGKGLHIPKA